MQKLQLFISDTRVDLFKDESVIYYTNNSKHKRYS